MKGKISFSVSFSPPSTWGEHFQCGIDQNGRTKPSPSNRRTRSKWIAHVIHYIRTIYQCKLFMKPLYLLHEEKDDLKNREYGQDTVCPRSSDPFYIISYDIKWVATYWAYSSFFCVYCTYQIQSSIPSTKQIQYISNL